ncbi:unnamed protein product [Symbiodinium sp. CCMP2592]|nr:unnamed protein product [Symbiodinium sp. CCMP2592]
MFVTELMSRINHNKLGLDSIALAHCQCATPPISMSGLIHDPPPTAIPNQLIPNQTIGSCSLSKNWPKPKAQLAAAAPSQEVITLVENLHKVAMESQHKLECLMQQATTLLTTQHEAMTAMMSSCKQQLDNLESLVHQGTPDWS